MSPAAYKIFKDELLPALGTFILSMLTVGFIFVSATGITLLGVFCPPAAAAVAGTALSAGVWIKLLFVFPLILSILSSVITLFETTVKLIAMKYKNRNL